MTHGGDRGPERSAPLPVPDEGWWHVLRRAGAIAALWSIATFAIAAAGLPQMDPQCYSDSPTGGRVCPRDRDPVLTHLFDVRWPEVPESVTVTAVLLTLMAGIGLAIFLDTSEPWSESGGAPTAAGAVAGLLGAGSGLIVAGPGFVHPLVALGITGLGVVLVLLGLFGLRAFRRSLRRRYARHLRREHLRRDGLRAVARITAVRWEQTYEDDDALFTVTATFRAATGVRAVSEGLCVPREHAPVVGGTVVIVHDDVTGHPTGVDVLIEADPNSPRDPGARDKYPEAPPPSAS